MVIDTDTRSSGMPSNRIFMSSTESIATPGLADVAEDARVVGVVAAVRGEVEGDRDALAAAVEVAPVERVGFLGRREAGVLADRPRPLRVHRRLRAADERLEPGQRVRVRQVLRVRRRVQRLDGDALRRVPGQAVDRRSAQGLGGRGEPGGVIGVTIVRHAKSPRAPGRDQERDRSVAGSAGMDIDVRKWYIGARRRVPPAAPKPRRDDLDQPGTAGGRPAGRVTRS